MDNLPTKFRGVIFDDGWEFDVPCVIYSPVERYGIGGNSGHIENMVEDYCIDLCLGNKPRNKLSVFERKEFRWRGWNMRGMCKRKKAVHVLVMVKWSKNARGELEFEMVGTEKQYGKQPKSAAIRPAHRRSGNGNRERAGKSRIGPTRALRKDNAQ